MNPIIIILIGAAVVLLGIIRFKLHPVVALLCGALITALMTPTELIYDYAIHSGMSVGDATKFSTINIGKRLATAFGNTSSKIGLLIALASITGASLMRSGGAERIIRALLSLFGKKNPSLALLTGSFILAIPVFFDTVFYLMIPLVKSLSIRNSAKFSLYLMTIIAGGVMAHSLIPPTPGPLFVAEEMGIDLGAMIIGGLVIGILTVLSGYIYAIWANKKWALAVRDTPDISIDDLKQFTNKTNEDLPSLVWSLLPIILPILLITADTLTKMVSMDTGLFMYKPIEVLGDANIALLLSAMIAMILLWRRIKDVKEYQKYITEALTSAGMIILITSTGGAFGQVLQQTGVGIQVASLANDFQIALIPMAFFITAAVRSAQGSATVAMVTAMGVMSGVASMDLAFHPVYLALAIGCGSKIFAWMNDSAFWIISQMSGMTVAETIRHFSILLMVMAFTGLIAIMIFSKLFPFA